MLAKDEILQGRYRIVRRLGHGGMGAVYEAKDERLGSSVALKEIIIELDKIPTVEQRDLFRRAFEREARLLANLHHEVFPRVMDYFSEENRQFLIMELVHGDDLGELLTKNKTPFPLETALRWADQLLDALDYLHTQTPPIFHRDIKPQNLKVTARGRIKLLDFGIAKSVDQAGSTMTNQTFVGATLEYAPIEQVLPATPPTFREFIVLKHSDKATAILNQTTDARCDIYAVGATFYHLLTNRTPIDSAKRSLEIWEGNRDPLPDPREINATLPTAISAWLMKALEIERENRFSSALEMQKSLQTAINEAKAVSQPTEKMFVLPEQKAAPVADQSRAETEIIPQIQQNDIKTVPQSSADELSFQTRLSDKLKPLSEAAKTEPLPLKIHETHSSTANTSNSILTQIALPEEKTVERRRFVPVAPIEPPPETKKSGFNFFWLVPVFMLGLIGIGAAFWMNGSRSNANESFKPASNLSNTASTVSTSSTPTPSASPTPEAKRNELSDGGDKPSPTPAPTEDASKPANTPAPTVGKTPSIQVPPAKTPVARKTPKTKPAQDPNCVFTNSCQ